MNKKQIISGIVGMMLFFVLGGFSVFFLVSSCSSFQAKTYTDKNDTQARLFELCIKGQTATTQAGGNVKNCDQLLDDVTTAGKLKNFKDCFNFAIVNKDKLNGLGFDCKKIVFGDGDQDVKKDIKSN